MPRSLQLGADAHAAAASMSAATSPWKRAVRAGRPVAASFSAGDSRSSDHQQHLVAFERQLDALIVRGTLERTVSTSSSVGGVSATSESRVNARMGAAASVAGGKITGRRHRMPRRFVVTDIPDFEEFNHGTAADQNSQSTQQAAKSVAPPQPRVGKTEVKGRFTIIDLSPDSPMSSPRVAQSSSPPAPSGKPPARHGSSPRRRVIRKSPSQNSVRSEMPTTLSNGSQHGMFVDPVDSTMKARRVDLNVIDKHLECLQKESAGMKHLLEGMVSTNARWISALGQTGAAVVRQDRASVGIPHGVAAGPPAVLPVSAARSPVLEASMEGKLAAMQTAYIELLKKHDTLAAKNVQLEEQNVKLATLLEQQTQITDDLRVQLQQMSAYNENAVSDSDPSNESELMSVFGDQSSADVENQSPSGAEFTDYELRYELLKDALGRRRRRRYNVEEECMSDTSSEDSLSKSRSRGFEDEDNNYHFADSLLRDEPSSVRDSTMYEVTTTNRADAFVIEQLDSPLTLENMMDDQASQLSSSLHKQSVEPAHDVEPVDFVDPVFSPPRGPVAAQSASNQVTHSAQNPDARFSLLKRNDSLTSILLADYSMVSSNSSIASVGVKVSALTKTQSGTLMSASGTRFVHANSPTNQDGAAAEEQHSSLSTDSLFVHDNQVSIKSANGFGCDSLDGGSSAKLMGVAEANLFAPEVDPQFSKQ